MSYVNLLGVCNVLEPLYRSEIDQLDDKLGSVTDLMATSLKTFILKADSISVPVCNPKKDNCKEKRN